VSTVLPAMTRYLAALSRVRRQGRVASEWSSRKLVPAMQYKQRSAATDTTSI